MAENPDLDVCHGAHTLTHQQAFVRLEAGSPDHDGFEDAHIVLSAEEIVLSAEEKLRKNFIYKLKGIDGIVLSAEEIVLSAEEKLRNNFTYKT